MERKCAYTRLLPIVVVFLFGSSFMYFYVNKVSGNGMVVTLGQMLRPQATDTILFNLERSSNLTNLKDNTVTDETNTRNLTDVKRSKCYKLFWERTEFNEELKNVSKNCRYVYVPRVRGRTGNNMFQIAALLGTARDLDIVPVIAPSFPLNTYFNLPNVMKLEIRNAKTCEEPNPIRVFHRCKDQRLGGRNVSLVGFRQSWKYFDNVQDDVKKMFRFKETYIKAAKKFYRSIALPGHKVVGIHVRRGDISAEKKRAKGEIAVDSGYFNNSMEYFRNLYKGENVTFVIFSVDMKWCRKHINGSHVRYSPFKNPGRDLALMSLCDHIIQTYGTFGWWGAWLSGKPSVYFSQPRNKNNGTNTVVSKINTDFYLPNWIPMSN